jgi:hypothetical protein
VIHRTRRRPRVTSCRFRDLWWLVKMEALYMIACHAVPYINPPEQRKYLFRLYKHIARQEGERIMRALPNRRILG